MKTASHRRMHLVWSFHLYKVQNQVKLNIALLVCTQMVKSWRKAREWLTQTQVQINSGGWLEDVIWKRPTGNSKVLVYFLRWLICTHCILRTIFLCMYFTFFKKKMCKRKHAKVQFVIFATNQQDWWLK